MIGSITRWVIVILLLLLSFFKGQTQNTTSGSVFGQGEKEPLVGATIAIRNPDNNAILKYDITDNDGMFKISIDQQKTRFVMEITYLGYKKWNKVFETPIENLKIVLEPSLETLDEVVLESLAIEQKKDTISYNVNQLKKSSDVVISDVIKRLPGIEVKPTGEIFYQGKPINKYYIEGLNLLEGRYNLANENLSVNSVSKVEVLENHQPIKILDSIVVSDRAAINIKLKNNVTASGAVTASLGWDTDLLWKVNATPILFSKKKQFLGTYQTNNIGDDILAQTKDFFSREDTRNPISLARPNSPPFNKQFWLDNVSHLGSINFLTRNKKEVDNKFSASYSNENQFLNGSTTTNYFLAEDSVEVRERISSFQNTSKLRGSHIIEKNTKKTYLKNEIIVSFLWKDNRSDITRETVIDESLDDTSFSIGQSLTRIVPIGNYIFDFNTSNSLRNQDFTYEISPAQFVAQLQSQNQSVTIQTIENNIFKTSNSINFRREFGVFKLSSKIGFDFIRERFDTDINPLENRQELSNRINHNNSSFYIEPGLNFKNKMIEGIINLPFRRSFLQFEFTNENQLLKENFNNFEPNGWLKLKLNHFWDTTLGFSVKNRFGNTNSIYPNFVLTNYRNIQRFNGLIPRVLLKEYNLNLTYRNPLIGFFGNLSAGRGTRENNLLYTSSIDDNGFLEIIAIPENNDIDNENLSFKLGKRIASIKTTVNIGANYTQSLSNRIVNQEHILVNNTILNYNFSLNKDISNSLSLFLSGNFQSIEGRINENTVSQIQLQEFNSNLLFNVSEKSYFNLSNVFFRTKPGEELDFQNTNFLNLEYFYKIKKKNIDFFIKWQNILNEDNYVASGFDQNFSSVSTFQIRPSQFLFGARLSL